MAEVMVEADVGGDLMSNDNRSMSIEATGVESNAIIARNLGTSRQIVGAKKSMQLTM